jgi:hypothetical protein
VFRSPVEAKSVEITGESVHQVALIAVELRQRFRVLSRFLIISQNSLYGLIHRHQERHVAADDLCQNALDGTDLLLSAFICDQSGENPGPDILLVFG